MDYGLKGKVALVSAASKGLGKACAMGLAREGATLAICSRDEAGISAAAEEIRKATGATVWAKAVDVTKAAEIDAFIHQAAERFGRIDILVSNAGGPPAGGFMDFDDAAWEAAFQLTFMSSVRLMRGVIPHMRRAGGGRIIQISSSSIKVPIPGLILSNALRAGVQGMMKTMSIELAKENITVNTVCPGRIATERVAQLDAIRARKENKTVEQVAAESAAQIPMGRYGTPEEFAEIVVFLASDAARYLTGGTYYADGGATKAL